MIQEQTYFVKGMHCASCEVLIEKKILEIAQVKSVEASTSNGKVTIEYEGAKPSIGTLNDVFKQDNYSFFNSEYEARQTTPIKDAKSFKKTIIAFDIAVGIVIAFLLLSRLGIANVLNVTAQSSSVAFFGFGLLAGLSSCAALVGGIVLSMSKQWYRLYDNRVSSYAGKSASGQELYARESSPIKKFIPHILFNSGRIVSYALFGAALGLIGSRLQLSLGFTSLLIVVISVVMIVFGLQMIGVRAFKKFQVAMPKAITRYIATENNFNGTYMPFVMGAATFFLPCGFTVTAQGLALLSGSAMQGGLIMGMFALGTLPMLLLIGFSSVKFLERPHMAQTFSKVAGFLLLFFALFNIGNQMNVLGITPSSFWNENQSQALQTNLAPLVNGKQIIKMTVYASNYDPSYFRVKAGVPVRWEITSSGQPSCDAGAVVSNGLFDGLVYLNPTQGQITVKEFIPSAPGRYGFSCTMGMVRGVIEVVN